MSQAIAEQFIEALEVLEQQSDVEPMCALYTDGASVQNPLAPPRSGTDGAREFWQEYRKSFAEIRSTFSEVVMADGMAVLEWTSEGRTAAGASVSYDGVSLLRFEGDAIARFRTYFDSQPLKTHG